MTDLVVTTLGQLEETIRRIISEHLPSRKHEHSRDDDLTLYSKKQAAKLLGISESQIDNYRRAGKLHPTQIGGVKFTYEELKRFIDSQRQKL